MVASSAAAAGETDLFIIRTKSVATAATHSSDSSSSRAAPRSHCGPCHFSFCIPASIILAGAFLLLGLLSLTFGHQIVVHLIQQSMAITPDSMQFEKWLSPPIQPNLRVHVFHLANPEEVLRGERPVVQERGPYVYRVMNLRDRVTWHDEDSTLSYGERKVFTFDPDETGPGLDPEKDLITVPNMPLWTGLLQGHRTGSGLARAVARELVTGYGRGTPFVNVSVGGLLFGYHDDLPCVQMDLPKGCDDEERADEEEDDLDWGHQKVKAAAAAQEPAGFVGCKCMWGVLKGVNDTTGPQLRFHSGAGRDQLHLKGSMVEFAGAKALNFWSPGSTCDALGSQDGPTLPPQVSNNATLNTFFTITCRTIPLTFEKEVFHEGFRASRFTPAESALEDNEANKCYCPRGVPCFKSGLYSMEPCTKAPVAMSFPHFYMADEEYMLEGLRPQKDVHQFYLDVDPLLGLPMAARARFQLNAVIGSGLDEGGWKAIAGMQKEVLVPLLWAEEGFDEPTEEMVEAMRLVGKVQTALPTGSAAVAFVLGGVALIAATIMTLRREQRWQQQTSGCFS